MARVARSFTELCARGTNDLKKSMFVCCEPSLAKTVEAVMVTGPRYTVFKDTDETGTVCVTCIVAVGVAVDMGSEFDRASTDGNFPGVAFNECDAAKGDVKTVRTVVVLTTVKAMCDETTTEHDVEHFEHYPVELKGHVSFEYTEVTCKYGSLLPYCASPRGNPS